MEKIVNIHRGKQDFNISNANSNTKMAKIAFYI